jgi:hypothetical protein
MSQETPYFKKEEKMIMKEPNKNHDLLYFCRMLEKSNFHLFKKTAFIFSFFWKNWKLPFWKSLEKEALNISKNLQKVIISVDFEKENNMLLILKKERNTFYLFIKELVLDNYKEYRILTSEKILLNAKFFGKGRFEKIMIMGLNRIYFINIFSDDDFRFEMKPNMDINLNPIFIEENNILNKFVNSILNVEENENFTDLSFTLGECNFIYWSKMSRNIKIYRKFTKETSYYNLTHFFDTVESSSYNQVAIFYHSSGDIEKFTIIDFDSESQDIVDISSRIYLNKYNYGNLKIGVNNKLCVKIGGKYDQLFVSSKSIFCLFENVRYEQDMFKKITHPMKYQLKMVFSISQIFENSALELGKNSFFDIETSFDNRIWFSTFFKKGSSVKFFHAEFDYLNTKTTSVVNYSRDDIKGNDLGVFTKLGRYYNFKIGFSINKFIIVLQNTENKSEHDNNTEEFFTIIEADEFS